MEEGYGHGNEGGYRIGFLSRGRVRGHGHSQSLGYFEHAPAGAPGPYRPSLEMARKKIVAAWDRRIHVPVSRPGSWSSDPWLGDKANECWDSIELGKLSPATTVHELVTTSNKGDTLL
jgi:hypothetical protein